MQSVVSSFIGSNLIHFLPIVIAGAFSIAIFFERVKALFYTYPVADSASLFSAVREMVLANRVSDAIALCDKHSEKPAAQVIKAALTRAHQPEELIQNGLAIAVSEAVQRIQKRTQFLATIANVATLLGLLGTILGLVHSFGAIGNADAQQKSMLLAAGIATAMNATIMGLCVAIPSMIGFSFLMNKTNRLGAEIDQAALRILDILKQRFYGAQAN